jgi:tRNA-specific 2-thiouridylase
MHTVGQRRGLGIATGQPVFVTSIDASTNTVVVGGPDGLMRKTCELDEVNWISGELPEEPRRVTGKARYRSAEVACRVQRDGAGLRVEFDEPQRAITPGQALVLYDGEYVLGGGTIRR